MPDDNADTDDAAPLRTENEIKEDTGHGNDEDDEKEKEDEREGEGVRRMAVGGPLEKQRCSFSQNTHKWQ